MNRMRKAFTLMEAVIVIMIIGILATLGVSYLSATKEQAADKEAINNLILLSSAQKDYHMDMGVYNNTSDHGVIRQELKVMVSSNANRLWNYSAKTNGCVQARRFGGTKTWSLTIDDADGKPGSGACP